MFAMSAVGRANWRAKGSMDDDRTTVMSRGKLPFPQRRAPLDAEERTIVDAPVPVPRPPIAQIEEQTSIGQTFPKSSAKLATPPSAFRANTTLLAAAPRSTPPRPATSVAASSAPPAASVRKSTPPPLPVSRSTPPPAPIVRAGRDSMTMIAANPIIPPAPLPPSPIRDDAPASRPSIPSELPSSPVFVRDAMASTPSFPAARTARDPMLYLAAGLGMLGMIFTLGIVCGLVVSLRGRGPVADTSADTNPPPVVFAAAAAPRAEAPMAPVVAPVAASAPVATKVDTVAKVEAPKPAPPRPAVVASPARTAQASAPPADSPRAVRVAPARVASAASPTPASTKKRVAMPTDPDFDAANAANDLARAQLDASLR
jgi:hypothetical protein